MNEETHPKLDDLPIGIGGTGMRRETDSMDEIELPADRYCYWGAQTQRRLVHSRSATIACQSLSITPMAMSRRRRHWSTRPPDGCAMEGRRHCACRRRGDRR